MKREKPKKKRKKGSSMRLFFTLLVIGDLLVVVFVGYGVMAFLQKDFSFQGSLPKIFWLLLVSITLGSAIAAFLGKFFFDPISKLRDAMGEVAEGNFDVRLNAGKSFREVQKIYTDFNSMTQALGSTEILQTEFISNMSHDFKTPINAIEGYATLLQSSDEALSEEQKTYIDKILFNTERLTHLVGSILLLSKVDSQSIQTNMERYRLDEQVRQAILSLESKWLQKDTEFDVELAPISYTGNSNLMMHVWTNLIENAIKYGPQQGTVRIRLFRSQKKIVFTIADEGSGISEEAQKHLYDRFYQGDNSRKEEGNGLGLALVKQILKLCGGTIGVENLPERGCQFTVQLQDDM